MARRVIKNNWNRSSLDDHNDNYKELYASKDEAMKVANESKNNTDKALKEIEQVKKETVAVAKEADKKSDNAEKIAKDTNDNLNNIVSNSDSNPEVVQGRKPFGQKEFKTIGERLDNQFGNNNDFRPENLSVIEKIKNEFSDREITPKMFGAKADGVKIDTLAFRECLKIKNATIRVTSGTYLIDEELRTNFDKTKIIFDDNAQVIMTNDSNFIVSSHNECSFININAVGFGSKAKSAYDSCGIKLLATKLNKVINCNLKDFTGHTIFLSHAGIKGCFMNEIKNNIIEVSKEITRFDDAAAIMIGYSGDGYFHEYNIISDNFINGGNQNYKLGVSLIGHGKFNKAINNTIINCEEYGIVFYESQYVDNTLYGNFINNNNVSNIGAKTGKTTHKGMGIYCMKSHRTTVSDNFVEKCLINSDASETLTRGLIAVSGCNDINVFNNKTYDSGKHGIVAASCVGIDIIKNVIDKTSGMGIRLMDNSNLRVHENDSKNNDSFSIWGTFSKRVSGFEETLGRSGNNISISKNIIQNKKNQTIYLETKNDDGLLENLVIDNNIIFGDFSFVYVKKVKHAKITNNVCKSTTNQGSIIVTDTESFNVLFENNILDSYNRVSIGISYQGTRGLFKNNVSLNHDIPTFYQQSNFANEKTTLYFSNPPTKGNWEIGDRIINNSPTTGNFTEWIYTNEGWVGINKIV